MSSFFLPNNYGLYGLRLINNYYYFQLVTQLISENRCRCGKKIIISPTKLLGTTVQRNNGSPHRLRTKKQHFVLERAQGIPGGCSLLEFKITGVIQHGFFQPLDFARQRFFVRQERVRDIK